MTQLDYLQETASQTAGPYVHIGLIPHQAGFDIFENNFSNVIAGAGERIRIEGRVLDGLGAPCRDVLLECWHADAEGNYQSPGFRGWGRTGTDFETGLWFFDTIKPGAVLGRRGHRKMAPHVNLWLASRGINIGLSTRLYFEGEALNDEDPVIRMIEPAIRRETLIARREARDGKVTYVFDIRLQGERETVFFDI